LKSVSTTAAWAAGRCAPACGRRGSPGAGHHAPGHGADDRQPDRAADLLPDVEQAGGHAGVVVVHLDQPDEEDQHEQRPQAGPSEQFWAERHHRRPMVTHTARPDQDVL